MMPARHFRLHHSIGLLCLAVLMVACPGCKDKDPGIDIVALEGKVEKIEISGNDSGKITVVYYSEKQGQDVLGTGLVTKETEIFINGVASKLKDIREGDRVHGEVRIEKGSEPRSQTALKITIDRPKPVGDG